MFWAFDVVADGATGPGWLFFEQALEDGDCFLDWFFEGWNWRARFAGSGRRWVVVSDEVGENFRCLVDVDGCGFARWIGGMFDGWVLTVAVRISIVILFLEKNLHIGEWNIAKPKRWRRKDINIRRGTFSHIDIELLHFLD